MKYFIISVSFFLMFCLCTPIVRVDPNEIVLDDFAANSKEINISDIVTKIDYTQLETTQESLIGRIKKIALKDHKIYVLDDDTQALLVFDISGKFIRKIGSKGQGPGEYGGIRDFALSDSVVFVRDAQLMKVILYDTMGTFIAEKQVKNNSISRIAFCNGMPVAQYNYPDFAYNKGFRVAFFGRNLDLVASVLKSEIEMDEETAWQMSISHSISFFANVDDTLTFWEFMDDVVYKIIDENQVIAKYKFRYQNPSIVEDGLLKRKEGRNELTKMWETSGSIFLWMRYNEEICKLMYFKKTGEGFNVGEGLKNDKGRDFFPDGVSEDGRLYSSFSMYTYKNQLEENQTSTEHLDPKLQSLLRTCKFDDNPCIMLVTLK